MDPNQSTAALKPQAPSITKVPGIKHLIVDSSPLLTSPLSTLRGMALSYLVTPEVVGELRDKKGREVMREAELQLLPPEGSDAKAGFIIREPSAEAVARVTSFARKTGDIAVLSLADIRVLALCLTLELEENGSWRVRDTPEQVLTGPPKKAEEVVEGEAGAEALAPALEELKVEADEVEEKSEEPDAPVASTSGSAPTPSTPAPLSPDSPSLATDEDAPVDEEDGSDGFEDVEDVEREDDDDASDAGSDDSHESSSSWITPENVVSHKVKDLGLFTPPTDDLSKPPKSIMKAAVLTGDFAMQNVALQMGLNVLGSGGKRVREVRTWVLRCHACFKICKNPEKRFCPSCGGPTLIRTSITYVTATPENPKGYILHLKANFQYRLRGTRYSLANPKMGKAGGGPNAEPVLREDQKEFVRGVKTAEIMRGKETRAILRSVMDEKTRGERGLKERAKTGAIGGFGGWNDPEWQAPMARGEKGRKKGGKNGAGGEVRLDSSGMPVIGSGRRNVNESRKRH